jgi:uncharacterized membrane protein (UPF0182 family)
MPPFWTPYNDYWVNPNAISKQTPYMLNNIDATLSAYNLKNVETRKVTPATTSEDIDKKKVQGIFRNIPVWDGELLDDVYQQLQELRTYYDFTRVDVSHYNVNGYNQQVFLAVREMNTAELPKEARNWVNEHLVYTHEYGAVMTPAGQGGDEPMTWFLKGIPIESDFEFTIAQPAVYFGMLKDYPYVIVPNDTGEFGYPKGDSNVTENYDGSCGVFINSAFRKLIFAYYLKDSDILFTTKTNKKSRILFRRNFPKGDLVYGPKQVNALINQDATISQQLTLWDQLGSQVARGNMIIFLIGKMLIYIQPVYLKSSTTLKIPELKRLIMTQGQVVVMESRWRRYSPK